MKLNTEEFVIIDYTNWLGVRAKRLIRPGGPEGTPTLEFIKTEWHPDKQWILNAWDVRKNAYRSFAMATMHGGFLPADGASTR